jgi:DNA-binding NarL/FixJ family response regulator
MLKLLVIEDHTLVREGLVSLLAQVEYGVVVADRPDFESALALLDDEDEVDLILLDLALPGIDGFAGLDILRRRYPAIPVAVVSAFDDLPTVTRVMNLGASGFIPKSFSGEQLLAAVRQVLAGEIFRPRGAGKGGHLDDAVPLPPSGSGGAGVTPAEIGLTERQAQVLALLARGLSNREIAAHLDLSEGTVKIHVTAILKALGVASRTQALIAVTRYGIDLGAVF